MNTKKKIFIGLLGLTLSIFLFYQLGKSFSPGSYPYAESWDLKANESEVIQIITEIKQEHPELIPPGETPSTIEKDSWYFINFYYADTKEIVHTLLSDINSKMSTISFTSTAIINKKRKPIIDSLSIKLNIDTSSLAEDSIIVESRTINRDYGYFANKREIIKFEELILDKIKEKIN